MYITKKGFLSFPFCPAPYILYASKYSVDGESVFLSLQLYFHRVFFLISINVKGHHRCMFWSKSSSIDTISFTLQALFSSHLISYKEPQQIALISCLAMFSPKKIFASQQSAAASLASLLRGWHRLLPHFAFVLHQVEIFDCIFDICCFSSPA